MKIKVPFLLLFVAISSFSFAKDHTRQKVNFNGEWKFQLGDIKEASKINFDDQNWQSVGLPHTFSLPYFMSPDFYVGYGWYRKQFDIAPKDREKRFYLEFEAAFQDAEVFLNGTKVGSHKGGYTGFIIDITDKATVGKNTVSVRLNNLWNPALAPRAGEHTFSGGLYRDVYLVVTNQVHVDWYGTFIRTSAVSKKNAEVSIKTEIKNHSEKPASIKLKSEIFDPAGKKINTLISIKESTPLDSNLVFYQSFKEIKNPRLWDIEHPNLYSAISTVYVNGKKQDTYKTTFGIRSLKWTSDNGFFLNGNHVYLKGANVHQDHAGWGDAVTNAGFYRDVKMMKDAGFNFIRGSHYPHDPAFVESCDKLGILFWSEAPFWGIGGSLSTPEGYWNSSAYPTKPEDKAGFESSIKQQLREMIRIHRNSPSVIVWSMSNEPFFTANHTVSDMKNLLHELVSISHLEDSTRFAAIGGAQRPLDENRIDTIGDIAGYNGDGGSLPMFQNPGIPSIVSEYGSTTTNRPGSYSPGWGDLSKNNGEPVNEWRSGQAIWCGFDHGSIAGARLGKMGIVDYFRIPKRAWYWYRNHYLKIEAPTWPESGVPAKLRLEADKVISKTDGTDDIHLLITVLDANGQAISNNPTIQLEVVSGPAEFPTGKSIQFDQNSDISIIDGQAAIECRAWYAGKSVIRAISSGLPSAEITLNFEGEKPYIEGLSPKSADRVYVRFNKKNQQNIPQQFGQNNPTFASSFMENHPSGFAADGNRASWWQPVSEDKTPFFILDTEKKLELLSINICFPIEDRYRFKVELSENMKDWNVIADFMNNESQLLSKQLFVSNKTAAAVRVTFDNGEHAKISEIEIVGKVLE